MGLVKLSASWELTQSQIPIWNTEVVDLGRAADAPQANIERTNVDLRQKSIWPKKDLIMKKGIIKLAASSFGDIKPSHKGMLHKALNIPEDEKIPEEKLLEAKNSKDAHVRIMANYALNARYRGKK
jgi:hypothetical protein